MIWLALSISFTFAGVEKEIESDIKHVTVFPDRAQLTHETSLNLVAGTTTLRLKGLSPYIDTRSINVKGVGDFTILSVSRQNNYIEDLENSPEVKALKDQLETLQQKVENEKMAVSVLKEKEAFLVANRAVMANNNTFSMEQFKSMMNYYTTGMEQINSDMLKKNRLIKEYEEQVASLQKQLDSSMGNAGLPMGEILVTILAEKAVQGMLTYSYVVNNAGWYPSYDIRVENVTKPVEIIYKANVFQSTGVSWDNVLISLSNATPWISGDVPTLSPWFAEYFMTFPVSRMAISTNKAVMEEEAVVMDSFAATGAANSSVSFTAKREGETTVSFDIKVPYTILPDGQTKTIDIQETTSTAEYKYVTVPKLSPHAYLTAEIVDWGKNGFQSGEATLYFENSYVGNSTLDTRNTSDTLSLSLGLDNSIVVTREKRQDYSSKKSVGTNKTDTYSYLISVRNNKSVDVRVDLLDQVPLSTSSDMTVDAVDLSGGRLDKETGQVKWEIPLQAGESKSVIFTYSVKYPKSKTVILE